MVTAWVTFGISCVSECWNKFDEEESFHDRHQAWLGVGGVVQGYLQNSTHVTELAIGTMFAEVCFSSQKALFALFLNSSYSCRMCNSVREEPSI